MLKYINGKVLFNGELDGSFPFLWSYRICWYGCWKGQLSFLVW